MPLSSLVSYYYRPRVDSLSSFLVRNLRETFDLFAPFWLARARTAVPALAFFLALVLWAAISETPARRDRVDRLLPALVLALLLGIGMVLGVLGKYPFGGLMRHQFLLFLFAVLAGGVALDRAIRSAGSRWRPAVAAVAGAAVVASFALRGPATTGLAPEALRERLGVFSADVPEGGTVFVDLFNLIGLFSATADGAWRFVGRDAEDPLIETYEVRRGGRRFVVVALRRWWTFDWRSERLYVDLRRMGERRSESCQAVGSVSGSIFDSVRPSFSDAQIERSAHRIEEAAGRQGLAVERLRISKSLDVSMVLCRSRGGI